MTTQPLLWLGSSDSTNPKWLVKFVGGCDIIRELDENGELEPMVKQALVASAAK